MGKGFKLLGSRKRKAEVYFHRPINTGQGIRFTWDSKKLDSLFREHCTFVDFDYSEGFEFDLRLAYNQLMCLFFPIIDAFFGDNITVSFEDEVFEADVKRWKDLRGLENIVIQGPFTTGQNEIVNLSPQKDKQHIALLYGGGKDSLAALSIYSRLYPHKKIHLLRVHWSRQSVQRHKQVFSEHVAKAISEKFDVEFLECSSTFHVNLKTRETAHYVGIQFYHACFLQFYKKYQFSLVNYSYDALEFYTSPKKGYLSLRPTKAKQMSELLHNLSINTKIRNISFGIPSFLHYEIIKSDPRGLLNLIYMCEDTKQKWCYNCRKCFTFGILGLEFRIQKENLDFDYSKLFYETGYISQRILNHLGSYNSEKSIPYHSSISYDAQYSSLRHALHNLDIDQIGKNDLITTYELKILSLICEKYGRRQEETREIWEKAVRLEENEDADNLLNFFQSIGLKLNQSEYLEINNNITHGYDLSHVS